MNREDFLFDYCGQTYPVYLREGNAMQHIAATAAHFCKGKGLDVGAGKWPLPGAQPIDRALANNASMLPEGKFDYIFSSHCIEHLPNPVAALEHWKTRIRQGGVLFLYLPSHEMTYWKPQFCRRHIHIWTPKQMAEILRDLGFIDVIHSERDLAWSFAVIGFNG